MNSDSIHLYRTLPTVTILPSHSSTHTLTLMISHHKLHPHTPQTSISSLSVYILQDIYILQACTQEFWRGVWGGKGAGGECAPS